MTRGVPLTRAEVEEARQLIRAGWRLKAVARRFKVAGPTMSRLTEGEWARVQAARIQRAKSLASIGWRPLEIARETGLGRSRSYTETVAERTVFEDRREVEACRIIAERRAAGDTLQQIADRIGRSFCYVRNRV